LQPWHLQWYQNQANDHVQTISQLSGRVQELQKNIRDTEAYLQFERKGHELERKETHSTLDAERQFMNSIMNTLSKVEIQTSSGNVTLGNLVVTNHDIDQKLKASEGTVRELSSIVDQLSKEKTNKDFTISEQLRHVEDMARGKKSMELTISRLANRLNQVEMKKDKQKNMIAQLQEQIAQLQERITNLEGTVESGQVSEANAYTDDEHEHGDEDAEEDEDGYSDGIEGGVDEDYNPLMD
jgi:chromosome segregation ATPase